MHPNRKYHSPPVTFDPSHYAHLIHSISTTNLTNIQSSSVTVQEDAGTIPPSSKATPTFMVPPIFIAPPTPMAPPTSIAPPTLTAPPTSIAPPTFIATPSQVSPPVIKPRLSQGTEVGPSLLTVNISGDEVKGPSTNLQGGRMQQVLPLVEDEPVWVPFDPRASSDLPNAPAPMEGFDLYVDGVRFLPDNATIVKITVKERFATAHRSTSLELCTLPDLTCHSLARCPKFDYREEIERALPDQLVELRVWTVDRYTQQVVVVGVCVVKVYNDKTKKLNIGGHQMRLRSGYPAPHGPILPQSLDHLPSLPGCSVLLRLLPPSKVFVEPLPYSSGFYQSEVCKPTESEINVIGHYKAKQDWSQTVRDVALELARRENDTKSTSTSDDEHDGPEFASNQEENKMADAWPKMSDEEIETWMMERLKAKHQPPESLPPLLEIERCVDYERDTGVAIKIRTAFGLQAENCYSIVLTRVLPGPASQEILDSGHGRSSRSQSFLTKEMDLDSHMKAPRWKDKATVLRPVYDEKSVLLLQFFCLEVIYKVDPAGLAKAVIQAPKGKGPLKLDNSSCQGWGVLPIFDRNCVIQGTFIIPIFQNDKDKPFLKGLRDAPSLESWMRVSVEKKLIKVHPRHPSAIVSIWDGHFYQGQTVPLPRRDYFLHIAGDFKKFSKASQDKTGHLLNHIVLRSLPSVVQSEGTSSAHYLKEMQNFEESMHDIATDLVEDALLTTGQAPLTAGS
eukprot:XP_795608.3 PREDICTED: uncharacterized protein LOC590930 [Strongylocentrotus purpuratus]